MLSVVLPERICSDLPRSVPRKSADLGCPVAPIGPDRTPCEFADHDQHSSSQWYCLSLSVLTSLGLYHEDQQTLGALLQPAVLTARHASQQTMSSTRALLVCSDLLGPYHENRQTLGCPIAPRGSDCTPCEPADG